VGRLGAVGAAGGVSEADRDAMLRDIGTRVGELVGACVAGLRNGV
jgi:hypothetical protein